MKEGPVTIESVTHKEFSNSDDSIIALAILTSTFVLNIYV